MRKELADAGHAVTVVAINSASSVSSQTLLASSASFDLLQDEREVGAWRLMGGARDDIFIYRKGGRLAPGGHLRKGDATNLSTAEGYANVFQAIVAADELGPSEPCGDGSDPAEPLIHFLMGEPGPSVGAECTATAAMH